MPARCKQRGQGHGGLRALGHSPRLPGDLQRALQGFPRWQIPEAPGCAPLMLSFPWRWKEKPTQKPAPSPPRPQSQHQDIPVIGTPPGWAHPFPGSGDAQGEHQSRAPVLRGEGAMRALLLTPQHHRPPQRLTTPPAPNLSQVVEAMKTGPITTISPSKKAWYLKIIECDDFFFFFLMSK